MTIFVSRSEHGDQSVIKLKKNVLVEEKKLILSFIGK